MTVRTFLNGRVTLHSGDCIDVLAAMAEASVDSVVCDPPYHLTSIVKRFGGKNAAPVKVSEFYDEGGNSKGSSPYKRSSAGFMGKQWDGGDIAFRVETWEAVFRVLKPGGHLVAFSGTRTYHRMACAIEDAGFEMRDMLSWLYGSGFPKSHSVDKAIDRAAGVTREVVGKHAAPAASIGANGILGNAGKDTWRDTIAEREVHITAPATDDAKQWQGWGTALKPSNEPLCLAQKPYDLQQNIDTIGSCILQLWSRLWSMLSAKDAAKLSALSPHVFGVDPSVFAQWSVGEKSSTQAALCAQMDTSQFASALISSLNTVSSWSAIWADASQPESMSITATELSTTIGWRTLRFLLSKITPEGIIQAHKTGRWSIANASPAVRSFNASVLRLSSTLELSVLANAISQEAQASLDVDATPNCEPICLARKPLVGTVAENVLLHGVGALNIDACRVEAAGRPLRELDAKATDSNVYTGRTGAGGLGKGLDGGSRAVGTTDVGRWPANTLTDGSEEVLAAFPETADEKERFLNRSVKDRSDGYGMDTDRSTQGYVHPGGGSAARFFYTAKADAEDRLGSKHPTVKPLDLMQWLVRLVTPKGGTCLDPFAGTGTTGEAAWREGMNAVLIEREPEYQDDIARRMDLATKPTKRAAVAASKNKLDNPNELPLFADTVP